MKNLIPKVRKLFYYRHIRNKKSKNLLRSSYFIYVNNSWIPIDYNFGRPSSETVSFFLPFARREAKTLRPLAVVILSRNPCLFLLFLCEG
jgi:hypothetical protein